MAKKKRGEVTLGIDIGGTKMLAAVCGTGRPAMARCPTKSREGFAAAMRRLTETVDLALGKAELTRSDLYTVGVACAGPLDLERGIVLKSPNLGWNRAPLKARLEDAFGCPAHVINDVDAGLYGEYRSGAAEGARCALGIFPGTGIGAACVYEGILLRGRKYSCMELGHIQVLPDGPPCGCGRRGCLEALAGRLAIAQAAAAAAYRGQAPYLVKESKTRLADLRSGALAASIAAGDQAVERIVRDAARWLGIGAATAINLLAPDVVVLGGGLVEAMPSLYIPEVRRVARERVMLPFQRSFRVVAARLGDQAAVVGAGLWAREREERRVP